MLLPNRWSILAILFLARFAMAFQFQSVAALAPLITDRFAASLAEIGVLIGLFFAPGIVIAIPGGAIATRFGDKRVVLIGLFLMLAGGALMAFGSAWSMLVIGRLLAGIGGVIVNVLMTKLLTGWFAGREIATAMGIFINSWPLGIAAALLVLPFASTSGGAFLAWITVLCLIAIATVLFAGGYRPPARATGPAPVGQRGKLPILALCLAGSVWALFNTGFGMVFSFGPALLGQLGWSLTSAASTTSLFIFLSAVSLPLGGIIADRTGRRDRTIFLGLTGFAILLIAIPFLPLAVVPAAFALMGLISGLPAGPIMTLPSVVLRPESRALGMSVFFSIYYGAFMVAPSLAGWLADLTGNVGTTFLLGAAMLGVSIASLGLFRRVVAAQNNGS